MTGTPASIVPLISPNCIARIEVYRFGPGPLDQTLPRLIYNSGSLAIFSAEGATSGQPSLARRARNCTIGRSALKARLNADCIFHIKRSIECLLRAASPSVALSALAFFLRYLGLRYGPKPALRLP